MKSLAVGLALAALFAAPAVAEVAVQDAYVRSTGSAAAAYFLLENHGQEDRLLSVATAESEVAELHSSAENADGVMQMLSLGDGVVIPAHGAVAFAPGGNHVMMMGVRQTLQDGDVVTLTLTFARQGEVVVRAPVDNARKPGAADHAGHGAVPAVTE